MERGAPPADPDGGAVVEGRVQNLVAHTGHRRRVGWNYKGLRGQRSVAYRLLHGIEGANQLSDSVSWLNWAFNLQKHKQFTI